MGLLDVARQAEQAQLARDASRSRHGILNDDQPLQRAMRGGSMYGSLMQDPADKARMDRQMLESTLAMMPMAGMTTYHGSPHLFNKFRMDKIGTGTGDANYGHGLYYTSNPRFAREHGQIYPDDPPGHLYKVDIPDDQIAKMLDWDKPLSEQGKHIQNLVKSEHPEQWNLGIKMDKIRNNLKEMADKYGKSGESYKEAIGHAPKKVQKEYQNLLNEFRQAELSMREVKIRTPQMPSSGESIYHSIGAKLGNPNQSMGGFLDAPGASEFLKSKGIPGIKYLDQGSSGAGQGTRNFVVFDENIPKILERNQQPIGGLLGK